MLYTWHVMVQRCFVSGILLSPVGAHSVLAETAFLDSAGLRLRHSVVGIVPPVILIHAYGLDISATWEASGISKGLAGNYRVVALDTRGHGLSQKPHDPESMGSRWWTT